MIVDDVSVTIYNLAALCVLSVRPSVLYGLVTPIFSSKGKMSTSCDVNLKNLVSFYLLAATPADQARQVPAAHKAYAIVRPTSLPAPEIPGNGTDGRIQCRSKHFFFTC